MKGTKHWVTGGLLIALGVVLLSNNLGYTNISVGWIIRMFWPLLLVYWGEPGDTVGIPGSASAAEGFPGRDEVVRRYAERSGRDVSEIDYYYAFGTWKLACIVEGVYARMTAGAYGDQAQENAKGFGDMVIALGEVALEATAKVGR